MANQVKFIDYVETKTGEYAVTYLVDYERGIIGSSIEVWDGVSIEEAYAEEKRRAENATLQAIAHEAFVNVA